MKKLFPFFVAVASLLPLSACSDDSSIADEPENIGHFREILSEEDLYACTSRYEGTSVFIIDEKRSFKCEDGSWYEISVEAADEDTDVIKSTLKYAADDTIPSLSSLYSCTASLDSSTIFVASLGKYLICVDFDWYEIEGRNLPKRARSSSSTEAKSSSSSETNYGYTSGTRRNPISASSGDATCNDSTEGTTMETYSYFYICRSGAWFVVNELVYDLIDVADGEEGSFYMGNLSSNVYRYSSFCSSPDSLYERRLYVFEKGWREADEMEVCFEKACTAGSIGDTASMGGFIYICGANGWRNLNVLKDSVDKSNFLNPDLTYGTLLDERDGKEYKTIKIGDYVWMAENLNFADSVMEGYLSLLGQMSTFREDSEGNNVGRLYTFTGALNIPEKFLYDEVDSLIVKKQHRGICPSGWHVPDTLEWNNLIESENSYASGLKSTIGWEYEGDRYNPTNTTGFSAVMLNSYSDEYCSSVQGYYDGDMTVAVFEADDEYVRIDKYFNKDDGCLLRCVQDYSDADTPETSSSEASSSSEESKAGTSSSYSSSSSSSSYSSSVSSSSSLEDSEKLDNDGEN